MNIILWVCGPPLLVLLANFIYAWVTMPWGWQDQDGFHFGKRPGCERR